MRAILYVQRRLASGLVEFTMKISERRCKKKKSKKSKKLQTTAAIRRSESGDTRVFAVRKNAREKQHDNNSEGSADDDGHSDKTRNARGAPFNR